MIRWKQMLAWVLMGSMLWGSFIPVQAVQVDTRTRNWKIDCVGDEESEDANTSKEDVTTEDNASVDKGTITDQETTTDQETITDQETTTEEDTNASKDESEQVEDDNSLKASEKVVSNLSPLTAKVIVLDPGHCAIHPGARGNGLREEVVVMDITEACQDALASYGDVIVYLTREDGSCCRNLELGDCLIARNNYAKILDADFLVSMHINAGYTNGANVLAAYKSGYNDDIRVKTQKFGKIALKELKKLGIANRGLLLRKSSSYAYKNGATADYYSIVRNGVVQKIPSVIIEHGYISSASDCKKFFKTAAQRKKIGKADAKAIISYYGLNKKVINGTFKEIDDCTYYVTNDGKKLTGWLKNDERWYYFDEKTGVMKTGFVEYEGEIFYLTPMGEMAVGWFQVDNATYLAKGNGAVVRNQIYGDGINVYLFNESGKQLKKGFKTIDNLSYYVDAQGRVASGVQKIKGKYYGFDVETYVRLFGYQKVNNQYYYFDERTGAAATKTMVDINGKTYYFGAKGVRTTGWVKYKNSTYYFNKKNGSMVKGWKKINKKYYYFSPSSGKLQKKKWIGKYYVNSKGVRTKSR